MPGRGVWGFISFWGLHVWLAGHSVVFVSAFFVQFSLGEFPCPLCMLQRYGMFLCSLGAMFVIIQARAGALTASRYAQGLGMGLVGALAGSFVSLRQIALHIMPGDPGYGAPVLGTPPLHLGPDHFRDRDDLLRRDVDADAERDPGGPGSEEHAATDLDDRRADLHRPRRCQHRSPRFRMDAARRPNRIQPDRLVLGQLAQGSSGFTANWITR